MDWTGNSRSIFLTNGASNHCEKERAENDYYATEPKAVELLLEKETFQTNVWECACGEGHVAEVFKRHGYAVRATDLVDRHYGEGGVDFLAVNDEWGGDIVTNPPYKYAKEFVEKSLSILHNGAKAAMFMKLTFLEGQRRRSLFDKYPPKTIYVASGRLQCAKNGDFEKYGSGGAQAYAWFVWEKGFNGDTVVKWIN